ncbi:uncharacterized protein F4812DRAFT_466423 [Daldinia caldariorum]|uniref:uncharacterized protein n=1 Tax=Daldinia caldariorum TaxID=326644 RepID=UPI0020088E39|nr:uncharacterized protein F4812DRAFT_466423 [Daldinia caldariorum]KAI1465457.1 hypothetical protein F4812DRAFT_466423 [Daldinia caldariorum]
MSTAASLHAKLDALYDVWSGLTLSSPDADFEEFADFFDEDCRAWLISMRELGEPSLGRKGVIQGVKDLVRNMRIEERRVVGRFDSGHYKISVEMSNRYDCLDRTVDPFWEAVVVTFNDKGLIADFKTHCCRSPMVAIIQEVTGVGPYKCHDVRSNLTG